MIGVNSCNFGGESGRQQSRETIQNKGSDTMVNLALAWAEQYQEDHPDVEIAVTGGGSGTGIAALINNSVDIANASRAIKKEEIADAEKKGVTPVEFIVARDAIGIIVHPDNPVSQLTRQQLSDIYSGKIEQLEGIGWGGPPDCTPFPGIQLRDTCILPGTGSSPGGIKKQDFVFGGYPAVTVLGRDHQRGPSKPQCNRLRWAWIYPGGFEDHRCRQESRRTVCPAFHCDC